MEIAFICNAGVALTNDGQTLIIDAPNTAHEPFVRLSDIAWDEISCHSGKYRDVCGFFFTHDHPDHFDRVRLERYISENDAVPHYIPDVFAERGKVSMRAFEIEYHALEHAPIPDAPPHVVAIVRAGNVSVYIAGDSALDYDAHKRILNGRKVTAAVWNSMYLSRADTRALMKETAQQNFIYHMPLKPDTYGMWKKCQRNFERYPDELEGVHVIGQYPEIFEL